MSRQSVSVRCVLWGGVGGRCAVGVREGEPSIVLDFSKSHPAERLSMAEWTHRRATLAA